VIATAKHAACVWPEQRQSHGSDHRSNLRRLGKRTKAGSTVGGGLEAYLGSNWTAKAEYLYVDLGHVTAIGFAIAPVNPLYSISYTEHLTENIVRLGVNYHFSGLAGLSY
jgi:opacity protein-like surface antigen